MKIALCSVVSNDFLDGFLCMHGSLRRHNPSWNFPILIFHNPELCPLSDHAQARIAAECPEGRLVEVDNAEYGEIFDYARNVLKTPDRLKAAFYILEAFCLEEFDMVVCLDSDLLILGSLDYLLAEPRRFSAVRAREPKNNNPAGFVNTGVMTIGLPYLAKGMKRRFMDALSKHRPKPGSGKADQAMVNIFFPNSRIHYLPTKFNYTKRILAHEMGFPAATSAAEVRAHLRRRDVRVLHFVAEKPWDAPHTDDEPVYLASYRLWRAEFDNL
jgi:hypothetical protein